MAASGTRSWRLALQDVLAGLASLGSGDLSALPLEALAQELLQRLASICRAPLAGLARVDAAGCPLPWLVSRLDDRAALPAVTALETFVRRVLVEARPCQWRLDGAAPAAAPAGAVRVLLGAPLLLDGSVFGAVYVGLAEGGEVRREQLDCFALLADRLALGLERARVGAERRAIEQARSDFLAMASHELRTPLTGILGYTDLLLRQVHGPLNDQQLAYQRAVRASGERLLALADDLLEAARLQCGACELVCERVDVAAALREAAAAVADQARCQGVRVRVDSPPSSLAVLADRSRLRQMLRRLLANAITLTPSGGEVVLSATPFGEGEVCLTIRETGAGPSLSPWRSERAWEGFSRADSSIDRAAGGAGLSIIKRLAELQGGRAWAESEGSGLGGAFSVALPAAPLGPMPGPRSALMPSEGPSS